MRVAIIDDETKIRKGLRTLLEKRHPAVRVVAEAGDVGGAVEVLKREKIDLVFLDIQLSDGNSFDVLHQLTNPSFSIVFITAYEQYAIRAFQYSAIHYLLKPVIPQELDDAVHRVQQNLEQSNVAISILKENLDKPKKIVLKTQKEYHVVLIENILRCQADQSYTTFYLEENKSITVSKPLKEYEELLPSQHFLRVHQSHLVNTDKISGYNKEGFLLLRDASQVPVSTRKKEQVLKHILG